MTYEQRQNFYAEVLKDVNALRAEWEMEPLTELPRGTAHGDWNQCAIGEAFELGRNEHSHYDAINYSSLLDRYERLYECGELPEIEPLPV